MKTERSTKRIEFQNHSRREVVGKFDGGAISSDAGGLLLREVEGATGVIKQVAERFTDNRDKNRIEHSLEQLPGQRIYGIAL